MDPRVGTEFAGHRIERVIGRGGASVVYLAEHLRLGRKVALKVLAPHLADDEDFRERFIRESRIAAGLDHPNVVTVYDAGEDGGSLFISMRYVEGRDLAEVLEAEGALEPVRAISILSQISSALDAAHAQGLVHRDVKPENILVEAALVPGVDRAYLSDFGISKRTTSREGLTRTGQFVGTVDYVAPEQITGQPVDGRTDVYSLGCVLFECLCGRVPFLGETGVATIYSHLHDRPPSLEGLEERGKRLDRVIARALAKSKEARFETCGLMMEAVRAELVAPVPAPQPAGTGSAVGEHRAGAHRPVSGRSWFRRHVPVTSASVVVAVALAVALALALPGDGADIGGPTGTAGRSSASPETTGPTGPTTPGAPPPRFVWTPAYAPERSGLLGGAIIDAVVLDDAILAVGHTSHGGSISGLDDAAAWRSDDGRQWHPIGQGSLAQAGDQRMITIVDFGGRLIAGGWSDSDGAVWTSADSGDTWVRSEEPSLGGIGLQRIRDIIVAGTELVAVGSSGLSQQQEAAVWVSPDGLGWDRVDAPAFVATGDQEMFAARSLDERVVVVGITNELGTIDGAAWTFDTGGWTRVPPASFAAPGHQVMLDVAGGGGELPLVAVGCEDPSYRCDTDLATDPDAVVWTSQDGSSWERLPETGGRMAGPGKQVMRALIAYRGGVIAVGSSGGPLGDVDGGVWTSADGIAWRAPTQSSPNVTALGGQGNQSLRGLVVYRRGGITLLGFGATQVGDAVDAQVWSARELVG